MEPSADLMAAAADTPGLAHAPWRGTPRYPTPFSVGRLESLVPPLAASTSIPATSRGRDCMGVVNSSARDAQTPDSPAVEETEEVRSREAGRGLAGSKVTLPRRLEQGWTRSSSSTEISSVQPSSRGWKTCRTSRGVCTHSWGRGGGGGGGVKSFWWWLVWPWLLSLVCVCME